ncbi:uncharacterized protein LOC122859598 [Aphidius gifuensis]|uniref:uncharacterized protein LOC122859598 n=1 Tax=Aphidius gifuensis TaxID=684658 RepID=UPI001CDBF144|nr:uncharacterized protein LOC122859598 [Aphidius gifuensis]
MTKKPKADNDRVYQKDWEKLSEFKGWLQECPPKHRINNQKQQAYCTWCNVALRCHKNSIKRHSETIVHKQAASSRVRKTQPVLAKSGIYPVGSNESKIIDIKLVINAAVHGTMCSLDHITEILNQYSKGSSLANLKLHRTKASMLITNVIGPSLLHELIDDVDDQPYSIILDESTDVSTNKFMAYCIRYFSLKQKKIITNFLGFSLVTITTAVELHAVFKKFLKDVGLYAIKH